MANDKTKVSFGKPKSSGAIYRAPYGTAVPTDATTSLAAAYLDLGYISEDGLTESNSLEGLKAWGGDVVKNKKEVTFKFKLIESINSNALRAVYNTSNVTESDGAITVTNNDDEPEDAVWVVEQVLSGGRYKRIVIDQACLSELGDIVYKDDDVIGYEVTIKVKRQDDGHFTHEYISAAPSADND